MTNYIERYWRDATPQDAIKEPPMVARLRIWDDTWVMETLQGIDRSIDFQWRGSSFAGKECQVYDAPDPGEGWRLIDPDKDTKQEGDEYLSSDGTWAFAGLYYFLPQASYRRRIEQPKPKPKYVPFTWEDREQLLGRRVLAREQHRQVEFTCDVFLLNDDGTFFINGYYSVWLCKNATFLDAGEPVGKKVTL